MLKPTIFLLLTFFCGILNSQSTYTTDNSDLPDNYIYSIFVDSSNIKWMGTNSGLVYLNSSGTWMQFGAPDYFKSNTIKDIAYERTKYGKELWLATDKGLSVASYTEVDGVTGATTYIPDSSGIYEWNINHILVDLDHNRWAAGDSAISLFRGSEWDTLLESSNANGESFLYAEYPITALSVYEPDSQVYVSTAGQGIMRKNYDDIDGFTGASSYGRPWSAIKTDTITKMDVKENIQWYGTAYGAYLHTTNKAKDIWKLHTSTDGLIDNTINAIHIDNKGNVWFGNKGGLSIYTDEGWYRYTTDEGLLSTNINCITSDMDSNIWIGTTEGVQWFSSVPGTLYDPITGISYHNKTGIELAVYPNPVRKNFDIQIDSPSDQYVSILLVSVTGQILQNMQNVRLISGENRIPVEIQQEYSGILFLQVINNQGAETITIIKE